LPSRSSPLGKHRRPDAHRAQHSTSKFEVRSVVCSCGLAMASTWNRSPNSCSSLCSVLQPLFFCFFFFFFLVPGESLWTELEPLLLHSRTGGFPPISFSAVESGSVHWFGQLATLPRNASSRVPHDLIYLLELSTGFHISAATFRRAFVRAPLPTTRQMPHPSDPSWARTVCTLLYPALLS